MGRRAGRPVLRSKTNLPEMGARRKKFDAHAGPFFGSVAKVNDSAFLLFLCYRINQQQVCAKRELFLKIKQASVSIDHDRLAVLAEFPAVNALARCAHWYASENSRAAALLAATLLVDLCFAHSCFLSCTSRDPESTTPAAVSA